MYVALQGYGLIPGDKCGKFAEDHPCITPYYLSGPHSANCVKKLWKNAQCTDEHRSIWKNILKNWVLL